MEARVEDLIDNARQNIDRGRFLLAADSVLDVANDLLNHGGQDEPELRLEINRLKGTVARDRFDAGSAILHFERARAYANRLGKPEVACELSIGKATAAGIALDSHLAAAYLTDARREANLLRHRHRNFLDAELMAREVQQLELAGDLERAEEQAKRYLRPVRRLDEPNLIVSRLSTVARIQLQRTGFASAEVERWLEEAGNRVQETGSTLRQLQWHVAVAMFLEKIGDPATYATVSKIRDLKSLGQLRHRPAERLLYRYGFGDSMSPELQNNKETIKVTYNISGTGHNISFGGENYTQIANNGAARDKELLFRTLRESGVSQEQIAELDAALTEDASNSTGEAAPGPAVERWYEKVNGVAGKVAIGAAGGALGRAIAGYFGLS